jgi:hypothetical protein
VSNCLAAKVGVENKNANLSWRILKKWHRGGNEKGDEANRNANGSDSHLVKYAARCNVQNYIYK